MNNLPFAQDVQLLTALSRFGRMKNWRAADDANRRDKVTAAHGAANRRRIGEPGADGIGSLHATKGPRGPQSVDATKRRAQRVARRITRRARA